MTTPFRPVVESTRRALDWLPKGNALSESVWESRHRFMMRILLLHLPFLLAVGVINGEEVGDVLAQVAVIAATAALAHVSTTRPARTIWMSIGLLSCSAILVHVTHGLTESHFHFFVMLPLVASYQDWRPFLSGIGYVIVHHGIIGSMWPEEVYNHPEAIARPFLWAMVYTAYVLGLAAVLVFYWKFAEQAEGALRRSEERFRTSFAEAPIGMCLLTSDVRFVQVNRALCQMLGREEAELLEMSTIEITHPDDIRNHLHAVARLVKGSDDTVQLEQRFVRADGDELWAQVSISMLSRRRGTNKQLIAQIEDVTERKQYEERLETLVRSKDEFVASVSHELRTPLTAVLGLTQVLREDSTPEEERREMFDMVATQSIEIANIVEDLLVAARADIGKVTIRPEVIDLAEQTRLTLPALPQDQIDRIEVGSELVWAWADSARVRQILRNLIANALRYGGPKVSVGFGSDENRAWVEIVDDGPGIPEEARERVFEPYQRAHETPTQPGSVGLGLTISRRLALLMHGALSYRSAGGLSIFRVDLPVAHGDPGAISQDLISVVTR